MGEEQDVKLDFSYLLSSEPSEMLCALKKGLANLTNHLASQQYGVRLFKLIIWFLSQRRKQFFNCSLGVSSGRGWVVPWKALWK